MTLDAIGDTLGVLTAVVALPLSWLVTLLMWRVARARPENPVLKERRLVALAVAVLVTVFGLIFLNNDRLPPLLATDWTRVVTRLAVIVTSVVTAGYWLWVYVPGGKQRRSPDPES